jgi:hypothetical protein
MRDAEPSRLQKGLRQSTHVMVRLHAAQNREEKLQIIVPGWQMEMLAGVRTSETQSEVPLQPPCSPNATSTTCVGNCASSHRTRFPPVLGSWGECLGTAAKGPAYVRAGAFNRGRRPRLLAADSRVQNNRFAVTSSAWLCSPVSNVETSNTKLGDTM